MSAVLASALYPGSVSHHRLRPKEHRLAYSIWSMLIDLDELDALDRSLRWFSVNRFNLFSFFARDRGDRSGSDLKLQVETLMRKGGVEPDGGAIRLMTMPRFLGYAFNPLSVFFCYRRSGEVSAILWEVDNTFGERHGYLLPVEASDDGEIRQNCDKAFYVSPFMEMDLSYAFRVKPPAETFSLAIEVGDAAGRLMTALQRARRVEASDRALLRLAMQIPFVTLKVIAGIHWEALKMGLKGIRLRKRPPPPEHAVSYPSLLTRQQKAAL